MKHIIKNHKSAFSLVELSIVIIVISIIISASLTAFKDVGSSSRKKLTQDKIYAIYNAIGNHLRTKGALPCPAPITDVKSSDLYGIEAALPDGTCFGLDPNTGPYDGIYRSTSHPKLVYGMIPVVTLGLEKDMAQDEYGNKFTYVINAEFSGLTTGSPQFKDADHENIITIKDVTSDGSAQTSTSDAILVIISHGENGYGAFPNHSANQNTRPSDIYEMENDATSFNDAPAINDAEFDNEFIVSTANSDDFDDVVFYKTRNNLINDFQAFSTVICQSDGPNSGDVDYGGTIMQWPDANYGAIVTAIGPNNGFCPTGYTNSFVKPTKKCGAFGVWKTSTINPCIAN